MTVTPERRVLIVNCDEEDVIRRGVAEIGESADKQKDTA